MVQFCCGSVLRDGEIDAAIGIVIGRGGAALFTVDHNPAFLARNRAQATFPVALEQQSATGVAAGGLRLRCKEVLAEKDVFSSITIKIRDDDGKGWSELRFWRERDSFKMIAAVKKDHRVEQVNTDLFC